MIYKFLFLSKKMTIKSYNQLQFIMILIDSVVSEIYLRRIEKKRFLTCLVSMKITDRKKDKTAG